MLTIRTSTQRQLHQHMSIQTCPYKLRLHMSTQIWSSLAQRNTLCAETLHAGPHEQSIQFQREIQRRDLAECHASSMPCNFLQVSHFGCILTVRDPQSMVSASQDRVPPDVNHFSKVVLKPGNTSGGKKCFFGGYAFGFQRHFLKGTIF